MVKLVLLKSTIDNRHTYIYTKNKKVTSFATGDDRAGGLWDLEGKDKLEDKETRQWLLECINKLPRKQYMAFSNDVGKEFMNWIENEDEE
jgi:DNA-directed RNA polymerase specialized sigma24 family protein